MKIKMKKLKRILLINWLYFSKELIEVGDINFLTGKNGAGKSTIIDAVQIVVTGDTNSRNFNQAANEKSQRTLEGYLRADMDEKSPHCRKGKDFSSYIACEFFDEEKKEYFVNGIIFDCHSDGGCQKNFFIYDGKIPENCFIENKVAMDVAALRSYFKQSFGIRAKLYDTQKQYRTDMLAKWNVHNEQAIRTMKKAISFRPISDISKFITEYICDIPHNLDIEEMQENIREYKRAEKLAQRQEERLVALKKISDLYKNWQDLLNDLEKYSFLSDWAKKEKICLQINKQEIEKEKCVENIKAIEKTIKQTSDLKELKEQRRNKLIISRGQDDIYKIQEEFFKQKEGLKNEQKTLLSHIERVTGKVKHETALLYRLCEKIKGWNSSKPIIPIIEAANTLQTAIKPLLDFDYAVFSDTSIFENISTVSTSFAKVIQNTSYEIEKIFVDLEKEKEQKQNALSNLRKNIKDYPKSLLQFKKQLSAELLNLTSKHVNIDILADVLEIRENEEEWRNVVEGYLNQRKFYLLVEPQYYKQAITAYDNIKNEYKQSFGLIDIEKIREKEKNIPEANSLATKIETNNDLARTYIDYLLGRVICCPKTDELRKYRVAVTPDGMLYQGYVTRSISKEFMKDVFIGHRAVEQRISMLIPELDDIEKNISTLQPINEQLKKQREMEYLFTQFFVKDTVALCKEEYLREQKISKEIARIEEQISHLDLTSLIKIDEEIKQLEQEIKSLDNEKTQAISEKVKLEQKIQTLEYEKLPELSKKLTEIENQINENYTKTFIEDVGIPRYLQELKRLKEPLSIEEKFSRRRQTAANKTEAAKEEVFFKRKDYIRDFQPCTFRYNAENNDEFAKEMNLLETSELPKYRQKIKKARESAMEQFQNDFLAKLKSNIDQVESQVKNLNKALKQARFGTDQYQFRVGKNPDYIEYYDMIMDPELMEDNVGLFALSFQQKHGKTIEELFNRLATSDDTHLNVRKESELKQNIELYTDFRTYLKFDLETTDQNGSKQLLSQTLNTKSGGETQTPFYIAILASFAQLYQVNNTSSLANNTVRLVVFDEAFNKMDSERIIESIHLLRKMNLQAIICTPPDKLTDIMPLADRTFLVKKEKYKMNVSTYCKDISFQQSPSK